MRVGGCQRLSQVLIFSCATRPFAFEQEKLESPPGTPQVIFWFDWKQLSSRINTSFLQPLRLADGSPNPIWNIKMEYTATWAAMEEMVRQGKTKSIGMISVQSLLKLN